MRCQGRRPSESRIILLVVRVSSLVLRPEEEVRQGQ